MSVETTEPTDTTEETFEEPTSDEPTSEEFGEDSTVDETPVDEPGDDTSMDDDASDEPADETAEEPVDETGSDETGTEEPVEDTSSEEPTSEEPAPEEPVDVPTDVPTDESTGEGDGGLSEEDEHLEPTPDDPVEVDTTTPPLDGTVSEEGTGEVSEELEPTPDEPVDIDTSTPQPDGNISEEGVGTPEEPEDSSGEGGDSADHPFSEPVSQPDPAAPAAGEPSAPAWLSTLPAAQMTTDEQFPLTRIPAPSDAELNGPFEITFEYSTKMPAPPPATESGTRIGQQIEQVRDAVGVVAGLAPIKPRRQAGEGSYLMRGYMYKSRTRPDTSLTPEEILKLAKISPGSMPAKDAVDILLRLWRDLAEIEGYCGAINAYDNVNVTWGSGFAAAGHAQGAISRAMETNEDVRRLLHAAGISVQLIAGVDGTRRKAFVAVDADKGWVLKGEDAERFIRADKRLLSLLIRVAEGTVPDSLLPDRPAERNEAMRWACANAQFIQLLIPGSGGHLEADAFQAPWTPELRAGVAHNIHFGVVNSDWSIYTATGGDPDQDHPGDGLADHVGRPHPKVRQRALQRHVRPPRLHRGHLLVGAAGSERPTRQPLYRHHPAGPQAGDQPAGAQAEEPALTITTPDHHRHQTIITIRLTRGAPQTCPNRPSTSRPPSPPTCSARSCEYIKLSRPDIKGDDVVQGFVFSFQRPGDMISPRDFDGAWDPIGGTKNPQELLNASTEDDDAGAVAKKEIVSRALKAAFNTAVKFDDQLVVTDDGTYTSYSGPGRLLSRTYENVLNGLEALPLPDRDPADVERIAKARAVLLGRRGLRDPGIRALPAERRRVRRRPGLVHDAVATAAR